MSTAMFTCPGCWTTLQAAVPLAAGQTIQCPQCKTVFALSSPAARPPAANPRRTPRTARTGGNRGLVLALVLGGAALALLLLVGGAVGIILVVWKSRPDKDTTVARADTTSTADTPARAEAPAPALAPAKKKGVLDLLETPAGDFDQVPPAPAQPPVPGARQPIRPNRPPRLRTPRGPMPGGNWQPEPTMLNQLGAEMLLGRYRLRPPLGYTLERRRKDGTDIFVWKGPTRPDGNSPQLLATLVRVPLSERGTSAEAIFDAVLDGCRRGQAKVFPTWNAGAHEQGTVNGIPFVRTRISGSNDEGLRMKGFAYLAVDSNTVVFLLSLDLIPHDTDSLRLTEAATLTLHR
jgi:hypothetical protein